MKAKYRAVANRQLVRIRKTTYAIASKMITDHLGRWCEVRMNKTGDMVKVVRTGYGPMERPESDPAEVYLNGELVGEFDDLHEVAQWMCENY